MFRISKNPDPKVSSLVSTFPTTRLRPVGGQTLICYFQCSEIQSSEGETPAIFVFCFRSPSGNPVSLSSFASKGGESVLRNRLHPFPLRAQKVGVGESSRLGFAARKTDCSALLTFKMGAGGGGGLGWGEGGVFRVRRGWWVSPRV